MWIFSVKFELYAVCPVLAKCEDGAERNEVNIS